jgi:hypothetical protein
VVLTVMLHSAKPMAQLIKYNILNIMGKRQKELENCQIDSNLSKYYYFIKNLKIDVRKSVPIIKEFDIFAVSNAGLEAGWSNMNSYSIPIHFVVLDIENSSDLIFMIKNQAEPQTNLEHPGYYYQRKVGIFPSTEFKIEKLRFEYNSQTKIISNVNEGIIGQTRIAYTREDLAERPFLRISIQSKQSNNYVRFINKKKHDHHINSFKKNKSVSKTFLGDRELRVDYPDDPELTNEQFDSLNIHDKFIYKLTHERTELCDNPDANKYEKAWESYARKNKLSKYDEALYFDFTSSNPGENLPSFSEMDSDIGNIKKMFHHAHDDENMKEMCNFQEDYVYKNWIRMPNDLTHDDILDTLNKESDSQKIFKGLKLREIFTSNLIPSEGFFEAHEPKWSNNQMYHVHEVGIYTSEGILTRYSLRTEFDKKFKDNNFDRITWFPFRILGDDSQVVNILKDKLDPFNEITLNISVDKYGIVMYSKTEVATNENEKKMLWQKFQNILFDKNGNSMVFMGKVLGFISIEKIKKILLIGSNRGYNYHGFIQLSHQLNDLMKRGFGLKEYRNILNKLFKNSPKKKKNKDVFNERRIQMLF